MKDIVMSHIEKLESALRDLQARAERDAVKARALERYIAAKRARDVDAPYPDAVDDEFIAARRAVYALCPASTKGIEA